MPTISGTVTLVANVSSIEQIAGPYEFPPWASSVELYAVTSATPANTLFLAGSDVLLDNRPIPFVGTSIDQSAHLVDTFYVYPGSRLSLKFLSTGTPTVLWIARITPM